MSAIAALRLLIAALRPYRRQALAALALGCATIIANAGLLTIAAYLIAAAALKPLLITLSVPMYLVRALGVTRAFVRYGERLLSHWVALSLLAEVRVWTFARIEPLAPALVARHRSGDLLSHIVADVDDLQHAYLRVLSPAMVAVAIGVVTVAIFAAFSQALAVAAAIALLAAGVAIPAFGARKTQGAAALQPALRAELQSQLIDGIQGMTDLVAFGQAAAQQRRIATTDRDSGCLERRLARIAGVQQALGDLAASAAVWVILLIAVPLVAAGRIPAVALAALALLILGSFEAVQPLNQAAVLLGRTRAAGDRLLAIAGTRQVVADPPQPIPIPTGASLAFDRVSFAYTDEEGPVLHEVSFRLEPGRKIAVVGPSGAGKSTLINLALRFWDPTAGTILLGGRNIRAYALDDLRDAMAVAQQRTAIFTDTLRNNLRLARPDAADAELLRALDRAQLADLAASLPQGLDTWLGEEGSRLSGGERQRLAVARALLRESRLVLLDEITANLDPLTETALLDAIHGVPPSTAVLLISHRLVGMERMDEILVLDRGCIVERGTHQALLAANGLYRRMLKAQDEMLALS